MKPEVEKGIPLSPRDWTPDQPSLRKLAALQVTDAEVAAFFNVSKATFIRAKKKHKWIEEVLEAGRNEGKLSLRRAQWRKAVTGGHPTMLIWMGKQHLGQVDKVEQRIGDTEGKPLSGVLVVPATLTPDEWAAKARQQQRKIKRGDEG